MGTHIRIRRGLKKDLPTSAPSGMPLWCEDTKELYVGTGDGIHLVETFDADTLDGYHAADFVLSENQFLIRSGSTLNTTSYVYPPNYYTMENLVAFIPSIRALHYSGDVDYNDSTYCYWETEANRIKITCYNTEQRSTPLINWLAVWRK